MLKFLVGAASLAIIAPVGFYFYQVYTTAEEARAAQKAADAAVVKQALGEFCHGLPAALIEAGAFPTKNDAKIKDLARSAWICLADGTLLQSDLLMIPTDVLFLDGAERLKTNSGCIQIVRQLAHPEAAVDPFTRARQELQLRGCAVDRLVTAKEVRAIANDFLDYLLGALAFSN